MFENAEVNPEDLPRVETVDWQSMDSNYLRRQLTAAGIAIFFVVVGAAAMHIIFSIAFTGRDMSFGGFWLIPVLIAIPLFTWPLVSVPRKGYAVRERDIVYRSGIFWRTVTAIPFNRIQHVEKSSTPLDRRFQLASLQLFTAGGTGGDLKIHGLPAASAEKLRQFILDKIGNSVEQA